MPELSVAQMTLHSRGPHVIAIQEALNQSLLLMPPLNEDGHFGPRTEWAAKLFQQQFGLMLDGLVGDITMRALGYRAQTAIPKVAPAAGKSWLEIAEGELDTHEDSRPGKHTLRILDYHATTTLKATRDETPWCSSFVNWVVIQAGGKGTNSALAKSWLGWGQAVEPRPGCIIVLKRKPSAKPIEGSGYHCGFLMEKSEHHVTILGGNQSDMVMVKDYLRSDWDIKGCRE